MWLARTLLLVSCLALLAVPAEAGTAEEPELADPGDDVAYSPLTSDPNHPYLDLTAVWITPAVDGLITLSLQTADNSGLATPPSDRHISCTMNIRFQNAEEEPSTLTATYRVGGANDEVTSSATWKPPAGPNGGGSSRATIDHNFSVAFEAPGVAEFKFDAPLFVGWGENITYIGATCNRDLYTVLAHNTEHTRDRDEASAEVKIPTSDYRYVKEPAKPRPSETSDAPGPAVEEPEPAASDDPEPDVDTEESPVALAPFVLSMVALLFAVRASRGRR